MSTLKKFSFNLAQQKCSSLRKEILLACEKYGGHLSSNLGMVELTYMLCDHFDPFHNDIVFDVGHQTYAYKLLTGRTLDHLREYQGTAPFSCRAESSADRNDNGHSGDALPTGIGIALTKKNTNDSSATIVVVGDASLKNGLAQEALEVLGQHKELKNFILIVNSNAMAIKECNDIRSKNIVKIREEMISYRSNAILNHKYNSKNWTKYLKDKQEKLSKQYHFDNRYSLYGLSYLGPYEGHDLIGLNIAFNRVKKEMKKGPVVLEIMTRKGMGFSPAESDRLGIYHGVKKDLNTEENYYTFSTTKRELLFSLMKRDEKAFLITPAMETNSFLTDIFRAYPNRCLDVGIAEEDAVAIGSGLALKDYHPVIDIYSTFLQRAIDEVIENISRQNLSATFLLERASLVGEDGSSHHGIYDVSLLRGVPNKVIYMPYDQKSFRYLFDHAIFQKGKAVFIRLSKEKEIQFTSYTPSLPLTYLEKKKEHSTLLLAVGPLGLEALEKTTCKADKALLVTLDPTSLPELKKYKTIRLYDPYSTKDGVSLNIESLLFAMNYQGRYERKTLEREFVPFGSLDDLYKHCHLTIQDAIEFFEKGDDIND